MKLELKHIQAYPPTLKIMWENVICRYEGIDFDNDSIILERVNVEFDEIKLILRPISFTLLNDFEMSISDIDILQKMINGDFTSYKWLTYRTMEHLLKNHYDVFGLIREELALNINILYNE